LVVNQFGELLAFHITKGNINDRVPVEKLWEKNIQLITGDEFPNREPAIKMNNFPILQG